MPDAPAEPPTDGPPGIEMRVRSLEIDVAVLKQIASSMQATFDRMDGRLERIESRLDRLEDRMWSNFLWMLGTGIAAFCALFAAMGHGFHWW
jgi:hypothetical protein